MSNYDKMADEAKALFMRRDQEKMIALWDLEHTDDVIVVPWLNQIRYLQRSTGDIYCGRPDDTATAVWDEKKASYCEYMVIYDLLTYAKERPQAKGSFATVASLGGIIGAGHDVNLKPDAAAQFFSEHLAQLKATCETLGGENVSSSKADECWDFTVFMDFKIRFEFWDKDEDFPASVKFLLDENSLAYMHYETLWYVMMYLEDKLRMLCGEMEAR